ncbi:hypothetical protein Leryth_008039 [Lithospermum erythrorhizon]|nr:hypothetical protein Leryth_008039 [Lithospermum erythrorhizon]
MFSLGMDSTPTISQASTLQATSVLPEFRVVIPYLLRVPSVHSRLVATSAVHESSTMSQFIHSIHQTLGLHVDVLSGSARHAQIYLGILLV